MLTKVNAESGKCDDQKLYVAVTRNINPYYFKLMVSSIRVGKQDTIHTWQQLAVSYEPWRVSHAPENT